MPSTRSTRPRGPYRYSNRESSSTAGVSVGGSSTANASSGNQTDYGKFSFVLLAVAFVVLFVIFVLVASSGGGGSRRDGSGRYVRHSRYRDKDVTQEDGGGGAAIVPSLAKAMVQGGGAQRQQPQQQRAGNNKGAPQGNWHQFTPLTFSPEQSKKAARAAASWSIKAHVNTEGGSEQHTQAGSSTVKKPLIQLMQSDPKNLAKRQQEAAEALQKADKETEPEKEATAAPQSLAHKTEQQPRRLEPRDNSSSAPQELINDDEESQQRRSKNVTVWNCSTTKGTVVIRLRFDWAPQGAKRMQELLEMGFFTNMTFFRVPPLGSNPIAQFGATSQKSVQSKLPKVHRIPDDPFPKGHATQAEGPPFQKLGHFGFGGSGRNSRTYHMWVAREDFAKVAPVFGRSIWDMSVAETIDGTAKVWRSISEVGDMKPWGNGPETSKMQHDQSFWRPETFPGLYLKQNYPTVDWFIACHPRDETR